jgi:hypothetical protein
MSETQTPDKTLQGAALTANLKKQIEELTKERDFFKLEAEQNAEIAQGFHTERDEARTAAEGYYKQVEDLKASGSEGPASVGYTLEPLSPGSMTSAYFSSSGEFVYHERTSFEQDQSYNASVICDRARGAIERGIGRDSNNRLGYRQETGVEACDALGRFDPNAKLEVIVRIGV